MSVVETFDWDRGSAVDQLEVVRRGTTTELRDLARRYAWGQHPETVLGWVTAQKGIDLGSALTAFYNGDPMRFNYVPKADVPAAHRGECQLLDAICQRINCGYYLPDADISVHQRRRFVAWMHYQQEDQAEGRVARWVLQKDIINPVLEYSGEGSVVKQETAKSVNSGLMRFVRQWRRTQESESDALKAAS